jgi:hypothetical protein
LLPTASWPSPQPVLCCSAPASWLSPSSPNTDTCSVDTCRRRRPVRSPWLQPGPISPCKRGPDRSTLLTYRE